MTQTTEQLTTKVYELEKEVNSKHIKWLETLGYSCASQIILDISNVIARFEQSGPSLPREGWAMIDNIKSKLRMLKND